MTSGQLIRPSAHRMVVVDDDPLVIKGINLLVSTEPGVEVVSTCDNVIDALKSVTRYKPDVVLADIRMPGQSGFHLVKIVQAIAPEVQIVLMTVSITSEIEKLAQEENVRLINKSDVSAFISEVSSCAESEMKDTKQALSEQEAYVARAIAQGKSTTQIAEELRISPNTVRTYLSRARNKTGSRNRVDLAFSLVNDSE